MLLAPVVAREPVTLMANVVTSVVILGVLGTGVAYVLNYRLIADEGATAASTVTYLLPAVLLGLAILAEPIGWNLAVGAVVILAGVALSERRIGRSQGTISPTASRARRRRLDRLVSLAPPVPRCHPWIVGYDAPWLSKKSEKSGRSRSIAASERAFAIAGPCTLFR
jgi:hypothetical protein